MRVHPEKSEGLAALLLRHGDTYDAELKADLLQLAERLGCHWWDVVIDCCVKQCGMASSNTFHEHAGCSEARSTGWKPS